MTDAPRRPAVFGPEDWAERAGRRWTWWDVWFCAVAVADYDGHLEGLEQHLVDELKDHHGGRDGTESKLSHMADLRARLVEAGLDPADLASRDVL
ncbi:MAG TPA: hypothetical protein VHL53_18185, partial [Acidimicrobiia bacterium]|nr:hypothetical protein [Acidimicrobiia bacterium]